MHVLPLAQNGPQTTAGAHGSEGRVHAGAVLALAFVLRLLVLCVVLTQYPAHWFFTRGLEMGLLAKSLLNGQGLGSPFGPSTGPTAYFAPAYPMLVAAVFRVFGAYSLASSVVIIVAQMLLNLLTVWLVMQAARQLFDARTANLAGAFWACSLPLLWLPTIFWETCLSTCILTALFPLALRCTRRPSLLLLTGMGAYCGLAALVNPALLPAMLAVFAWTAYQARTNQRHAPVLGLVAAFIVLSPWPIRNALAFHAFIPTRSNMGAELWIGNHPGTGDYSEASGYLEENLFPSFNQGELGDYIARGEVAYTADKSAIAVQYIQSHPAQFLRLSALRMLRFWSGTGNQHGSLLLPLHCLATTLLGFTGLGLLYRRRGPLLALLFTLPLALFPLPYYITHAEFRFRIVIDPLLTLLAAYAVAQLLQRFKHSSLTLKSASQESLVSA